MLLLSGCTKAPSKATPNAKDALKGVMLNTLPNYARDAGFSLIGPTDWSLRMNGSSGILALNLGNYAGTDVEVTGIGYKFANSGFHGVPYSQFIRINNSKSGEISVDTEMPGLKAGDDYSVNVLIDFKDAETGYLYQSSGNLTGTVLPDFK